MDYYEFASIMCGHNEAFSIHFPYNTKLQRMRPCNQVECACHLPSASPHRLSSAIRIRVRAVRTYILAPAPLIFLGAQSARPRNNQDK